MLNVGTAKKLNHLNTLQELLSRSNYSFFSRASLSLSEMVLVDVVAFIVLKRLHSLVFLQKALLANNSFSVTRQKRQINGLVST